MRNSSRRKISLYSDEQPLTEIAVSRFASNRAIQQLVQQEFKRALVVSHAVVRDRKGQLWVIERHHPWWRWLKFLIFAH